MSSTIPSPCVGRPHLTFNPPWFAAASQARLKAIKKAHGAQKLADVTVDMAIGGMRGIPVSGAWEGKG